MGKIKTGKDTVVIGDVDGEVGDGSVVIRPTGNGNVVLNSSMAVGRGAKAGPGTIAIGAGAGAGPDVFHIIASLRAISEVQSNQELMSRIEALEAELGKDDPDETALRKLWAAIQALATVGGAVGFVQEIGRQLGYP